MRKSIVLTILISTVLAVGCSKEENLPSTQPKPIPVDPFAALPKETAIPDPNFEKALIEIGIDNVLDGKVNTSSVCYLTELKILEPKGIQSIKGLESFISLQKLWIEHQKLEAIDLSKNVNLLFLSLWDNPLQTIDLTKNVKLEILGLSEVNMETVDLSKNINLVEIAFQNGQGKGYGVSKGFTALDLSQNINLARVYVWQNRLTSLDLSNQLKLTDIWFQDNPQLTSLKFIPKQNLKMVIGWNTGLESLDVKGASPASINMENCPKLETIRVNSLSWIESAINRNPAAYSKDAHTRWIE